MSCNSVDLEKQIVLRASRLMRVRSVKCFRSICWVLRVAFAWHMGVGCQMPDVCPPVIGEEACDPKGFQQGLELQEHLVLATAKYIRQDLDDPVIESMPQLPWLLLLAHEAPHFVDLCGLHLVNAHFHLTWSKVFTSGVLTAVRVGPFFQFANHGGCADL